MADLTTLLNTFLNRLYATGGMVVNAPTPGASTTIATTLAAIVNGGIVYTGTQRLTIQGTGRLRII